MSVLITTTVCVDSSENRPQPVVHISQGDSGTRALRLVPMISGVSVNMSNVAQAKVMAHPLSGVSDLLINCVLGPVYADMIPTPAMAADPEEWACQLLLLDSEGQTLHTMPFTVLIHADVWTGDTVEHTNNSISGISWDAANRRLTITLADGTQIVSPSLSHTHDLASASNDGFESIAQYNWLTQAMGWLNQDVRTTASPTFEQLTVGQVTIYSNGNLSGATFT